LYTETHLAGLIGEDAESEQLVDEIIGVRDSVAFADPEEHN